MRRALFVVAGLLIGFFFSNIPALIEWGLRVPMCRESCPGWFTATFITIYMLMPLAWAALLSLSIGRPGNHRGGSAAALAALASALTMSAIAFYAYAHQVPLFR